mgnify:CR=1 FL=1
MKFLAVLVLTISLIPAAQGNSGGWNSGGQGRQFDDDAAWYLSSKPEDRKIKYCIQKNSRSQLDVQIPEITQVVQKSFAKWAGYLSAKRANMRIQPNPQYVTSIMQVPCDGNQDLRFEIDTTNSEIEQEKQKYPDPVAFSKKGKLEPGEETNGTWYKNGYIWVSNLQTNLHPVKKSRLLKELEIVLTHEIGHVLGNSHIPGTIMEWSLLQKIINLRHNKEFQALSESAQNELLEKFGQIDQQKVLYSCCSQQRFSITFSLGLFQSSEFNQGQQESAPANIQQMRKTILKELFGINASLSLERGNYFPATPGLATVSSTTNGYQLDLSLKGLPTHILELGRPADIVEGNMINEIFQRVNSRKMKTLETFEHTERTLVFHKRLVTGDVAKIYLHFNRRSQLTLELADPQNSSQRWLLLLSSFPSL